MMMAKLFYTLAEASERLGKSENEVRELASSGQLEEMRDGDDVMFKRQQVDLLAGDAEGDALDIDLNLSDDASELETGDDGEEPTPGGSGYGLSDSGTGLGLGGSASGLDLGGSGSASGIGAPFEGGEDDDSAETRVSDAVDEELSLEAVGSGSGLLDLTRESDV